MRYLKYIIRNALRNKIRSALTILSLCVCLSLMSILYGYLAMQDQFIPILAKGNRVIVMGIEGWLGQLPLAHQQTIQETKGVRSVIPYMWYMGTYQNRQTMFVQIGTQADQIFEVFDECSISPEQMKAWKSNRQGCVVDRITANRYDWKVGEHIPLAGSNFDFNLDLTLCGIYDSPKWIQGLFFHMDYLDEGLRQRKNPAAGMVQMYFLKAESDNAIPKICEEVDLRFRNSDYPTSSKSHQAFAEEFSKFLGNIQVYIRNIGLAVVFSLMLVAGNALAMSMRERTSEIAILKAIGFHPMIVLSLVLGESVLLALLGGLMGVAFAQGVWSVMHNLIPQFVPLGFIAGSVILASLAISVGIGVISGIVPAARAASLSVIDGLRRVG